MKFITTTGLGTLLILTGMLALGAPAIAADEAPASAFSGEWVVSEGYRPGYDSAIFALAMPQGALFDFDVQGNTVTGSMLIGEVEIPIAEGKIKGDKITFILKTSALEISSSSYNVASTRYDALGAAMDRAKVTEVNERTHTFYFIGKLSDTGIKFEITRLGGGAREWYHVKRP